MSDNPQKVTVGDYVLSLAISDGFLSVSTIDGEVETPRGGLRIHAPAEPAQPDAAAVD
ncbi:hypothetical protein ACWCW7_17650 [Nocardia tengchongensis]